ncbi:MAG: folate family ECF transporter S component [Clostridiales bacterium]|nr:folate family ECF transporter S component [Clostridiales bacterium]
MEKHSPTTKLVVVSFMIAIEVVLTRLVAIFVPTSIRISLGFLPVSMTAIMFGPWWAGISYALGDIIGMLLFPMGPYFPGFTFTAFLTGMIFGLVLYKKEVTYKRTLFASLLVVIICSLVLDTFWLYLMFDQAVKALLPVRIAKGVLAVILHVTLIPLTWNKYLSKLQFLKRGI